MDLICPLKLITESNTSLCHEDQYFLPTRQGFETECVPYDSLRVNEERDTSLGETHHAAADAVCLSGFAGLVTQHRVLISCCCQDDITRM